MSREDGDGEEPFTLEVSPASAWRGKKADQFHDQAGLQRNLIDGLDCLPGQMDLFAEGENA